MDNKEKKVMSHNCFISFKKEDAHYKDEIIKKLGYGRVLGKSLDKWIDSEDIDYIMQVIRSQYMNNTSVTLFLIGEHSSENEGFEYSYLNNIYYNKQNFIIRELKATLYDGKGNRRSGLLGIVLPEIYNSIYAGSYKCSHCGKTINYVKINSNTVVNEFSGNYYLNSKCKDGHCEESERFCVLVKYHDFIKDPDKYINKAYDKTMEDINNFVHWRDINHVYKKKFL
jgi:hypothetical protein